VDGPTADNGTNTIDNADSFAYTVTDANGNTSGSTVYINITDDIPIADPDTAASVKGDADGPGGAGCAGRRHLWCGRSGAGWSACGGRRYHDGRHQQCGGHRDQRAVRQADAQFNGGYTYVSTDNGITSNVSDTFVYTIEDGDGDLSTTTLTINLTDSGLTASTADE